MSHVDNYEMRNIGSHVFARSGVFPKHNSYKRLREIPKFVVPKLISSYARISSRHATLIKAL